MPPPVLAKFLAVFLQPGLHLLDLGFLRGDDGLRQFAQFGILAVFQLHLGHVDRALMVRDHAADEIRVGIAAIGDHHVLVHLAHGIVESLAGGALVAHRLAHVHARHVVGKGGKGKGKGESAGEDKGS